MAFASRTRPLFLLICLVALVALAGCGGSEEPADDDTATGSDTSGGDGTSTDVPGDASAVEVSGEDRTYRFTALKLDEPDISLRQILNGLIDTAIKRPPAEPESVHVLLRFSSWDTAAAVPTLTLVAGAGAPVDAAADPVTYTFRPDAELVEVTATYDQADGLYKIRHELPTNLIFPLTVGDTTTLLPLRNILLDTCYGNSRMCLGTTEDEIYGTLTGAIIQAEADAIGVELSEGAEPTPLGDLLRDEDADSTCASDADCTGVRTHCNAASHCERAPDLEVDGAPAYFMAGTFKAVVVPFDAGQ